VINADFLLHGPLPETGANRILIQDEPRLTSQTPMTASEDEMDEAVPASTIGRRLFILALVLIILIAGWTGGWYWLRGEVARRMDDQIAKLATRGIVVTCPARIIGGWPFRMDIECDNPTLTERDRLTAASVKHLRVTALVYNPTLVLAELDGPLALTGPNGESVNATWSQLQGSIGFSLSSTIRPQRLSVTVDDLAAGVAKPGSQEVKLTSTHGELHARPAPDASAGSNDVDIAVNLTAATLSVADRVVGPEATDWTIDSVARGLPLGAETAQPFLKAWTGNGGKLDLRSARMSLGSFAIDGTGSLSAHDDGLLNGQIKLIASGLGALMSPTAATMKGRAELIGLATAFTLFGKPVTDGGITGRSLDLTIDQGRIKIGPTGFGHVPPLF